LRVLRSGAAAALALVAALAACGRASVPRTGDGGFDPAASRAALEAGDGKLALEQALAAVERAEPNAAPHELASKIQALALEFDAKGEFAALEPLLARALELREHEPEAEPEATASLLHDLSSVAFNRGDYDGAEKLERRAIARLEPLGRADDAQLARSRRDLGFLFLTQGRLAESEPWLVESLPVLERAEGLDWFEVALARDYLGVLRRSQGHYAEAERIYEQLVPEAIEKLGEGHRWIPVFINNFAGVYRDEERFDRAETLLHRSLELRRAADPPIPWAIAAATLNLAELYRVQGKLADAEPLYREALAAAAEAYEKQSPERFEFVNQLAVLYRDSGRLDEAEPLAREALALVRGTLAPGDPRLAQSELDLADLLRARGRCAAALDGYGRAVAIREQAFGPEHPEVAAALTARAECLAADPARAAEARADLDRAIAILSGSAAYPAGAADALALRARLRRSSEPGPAREDLRAAVERLEALRPSRGGGEAVRAEFLGSRAAMYERLATWEVEDGSPEEALLVAERGRGRALLDQLAAARVDDDRASDPESAAGLEAARAQVAEARARIAFAQAREDLSSAERAAELARLGSRLDEASRAFRAAYDRFRNASPAWRAAAASSTGSIARIQSDVVPRAGLLLFYVTGAERSLLLAVPPAPGRVEAFSLALGRDDARALGVEAGPLTRGALERVVQGERGKGGLLASLGAPGGGASTTFRGIGGIAASPRELDPRLATLFRVLVPEPLRERVLRASEVLIVPDGPLLALPFEALVTRPGPDPAATRFWLDDGPPVRYAPSASFVLALGRGGAAHRGKAVALSVSDAAYGRARGLARLPGTARETQALREALAGVADVVTLAAEQAREPAVRRELAGKRFVHLATHGLAERGGNELFAALALTPPAGVDERSSTPGDDGLLELQEIYGLTLDADVAVLSACGSNTGRAVPGEGVFALSRGFLVAGARRVVASLWPVDDDATAELVGRLFRGLADVERGSRSESTAAALREAKLAVRHRPGWEHPFFWAPFVLSGAG
jgi:hypothetical protein